ncbi:MAG TPA: Na+/H+ antiporter NhaA, partial [Anaerolineaceae bacterium]|nr:Na+/H+ antiporter NhaA [Anaerolineaceae bacterium]
FTEKSHQILNDFSSAPGIKTELLSGEQLWALQRLERATWNVETTLQRMEHNLHPWITYFIIPLFALANAGVHLQGDFFRSLTHPVSLGIIVGLLMGKQVGVTAATWLAVRLGAGRLPEKITWRQIYGISWLAGIGFTMSLFINGLAFSDDVLLNIAKMGILVASLVAGSVGWLILRSAPRRSFKPNLD